MLHASSYPPEYEDVFISERSEWWWAGVRVGGIYCIKHFRVIKPLLGVREQRGPSPRCVLSMTGHV